MTESADQRSRTMRAIKSQNTKPEMLVRRLVFSMGYRYRLHRADLPGKPDLVFPSRRKIIFVHGCFWHGHTCARGCRIPKTNIDYWREKISRNKVRDVENVAKLKAKNWDVFIIWECEIKNQQALAAGIREFLC